MQPANAANNKLTAYFLSVFSFKKLQSVHHLLVITYTALTGHNRLSIFVQPFLNADSIFFFSFILLRYVRIHTGEKKKRNGSFESPFWIKLAAHFFAEGYFKIIFMTIACICITKFAIKIVQNMFVCVCACVRVLVCRYVCILPLLINTKW